MIVLEGIVLDISIIYMFYHSAMLCLVMILPVICIVYRIYAKRKIRERKKVLASQFEELLGCLQAALSTGYSIENAFNEARRELTVMYQRKGDILRELDVICTGIRMNKTVTALVSDFARRSGVDDILSFSEVLMITKRTGGNLIAIVKQTADILHDKKEIEEDILTMMAAKRFESRIMCVMPIGMLFYLNICSPGYLDVIYGNLQGVIVMSVCLLVYVLSYLLGSNITDFGYIYNESGSNTYLSKIKNASGKKGTVKTYKIESIIFELLYGSVFNKWMDKVSAKVKAVYMVSDCRDSVRRYWYGLIKITGVCSVLAILLIISGGLLDSGNIVLWFVIGIAVAVGVPLGRVKNLDKQLKYRNEQMLLDYPEVINGFTLLLGAGISMKGAWERLVCDKSHTSHYIYAEMNYTLKEMAKGMSESDAYERFGKRIKLLPYIKFATMLTQNLRKGNRSILDQLKLTSLDAYGQRKESIKRLGEEASSKLLFPMMLQFALILTIVMYPAVATI